MFTGRSNAGPGLSINTTAANSAPAVPQFGSLPGGLNTNQPQGASGSSQPASTSSLFGANQPAAIQGKTSTPSNTSAQAPRPPLFGMTTQGQQPTGGADGRPQLQLPQQQSTNLFVPKPSDSIFGAQAGKSASTLFGATQQPPNNFFGASPSTQSTLFGPKPAAAPVQPPNIFGGSTLTLGQSNTQANQTIPGVRIDLTNLRPTTRFHDLAEPLAQEIQRIDTAIHNWQTLSSEVSQLHNSMIPIVDSIPPDVDFITAKITNTELALENDALAIQSLREIIRADAAAAKCSFRVIDALQLPEQFRNTIERDARDIFNLGQQYNRLPQNRSVNLPPTTALDNAEYFNKDDPNQPQDIIDLFTFRANDMQKQLDLFKENMHEIELHLRNVEVDIAQKSRELAVNGGKKEDPKDVVRQVVGALREVDGGIQTVAAEVESVREQVRDVMGQGVDTEDIDFERLEQERGRGKWVVTYEKVDRKGAARKGRDWER